MGLDHPDHIFGTILDVYAAAGSTRTNDFIDNSRPCDHIRKLCGSSHNTPKFVLLVSSLAVTMQDSQVPIRLYNYSSKHVYVKAGERLGTFMPWTYDTEIIKDPISHDINISNIEEAATPPTPNVDLSQSVVNTHEKQQLKILQS